MTEDEERVVATGPAPGILWGFNERHDDVRYQRYEVDGVKCVGFPVDEQRLKVLAHRAACDDFRIPTGNVKRKQILTGLGCNTAEERRERRQSKWTAPSSNPAPLKSKSRPNPS